MIAESLAATLDQAVREAKIEPVTFKGNGLSREFEAGMAGLICQFHGDR